MWAETREKTTHHQRNLRDSPRSKNVCRMCSKNGPISERKGIRDYRRCLFLVFERILTSLYVQVQQIWYCVIYDRQMASSGLYMDRTAVQIERHAGLRDASLQHKPPYAHARAPLTLNKTLSLSLHQSHRCGLYFAKNYHVRNFSGGICEWPYEQRRGAWRLLPRWSILISGKHTRYS